MNLKTEIEKRFAAILEPAGFVKHRGPWVSFVRREPTIHYHVDVENHSYSNAFSVTLQTVDVHRKRMGTDLLDLAKVGGDYVYPGQSTTSDDRSGKIADRAGTIRVIDEACRHLAEFGLPWLNNIKAEQNGSA